MDVGRWIFGWNIVAVFTEWGFAGIYQRLEEVTGKY
jgi:hypothetical protein